jgi:ribosomal protein S18 acetylase RimI-like enzyme
LTGCTSPELVTVAEYSVNVWIIMRATSAGPKYQHMGMLFLLDRRELGVQVNKTYWTGCCAMMLTFGCAILRPPAEMPGTVRAAKTDDLPSIERIAQQKFAQYARYQPLYYKVAKDSADRHLIYLNGQLKAGQQIMLVHETAGQVDGFLMANIVTPPPVYDQSLHSLVIDDFYFAAPSMWPIAGSMMLDAAEHLGRQRGAVQVVAVSGDDDADKNSFLVAHGLSRSAVWYTRPFDQPTTRE